MKYSIIGATSLNALANAVNKELDKGCKLQGGICVVYIEPKDELYFYQAITKE